MYCTLGCHVFGKEINSGHCPDTIAHQVQRPEYDDRSPYNFTNDEASVK